MKWEPVFSCHTLSMKAKNEQNEKHLMPAVFRKNWQVWLCVGCFVVSFLIAGSIGWLIVHINDDHPGQSLDYDAHARLVQQESMRVFLRDGLNAGLFGLGIGGAVGLLITMRKRRVKDKSH